MKLCKNKLHEMTPENRYRVAGQKRPAACKACKLAANKRYYDKYRLEKQVYNKAWHLRTTYGLSLEQLTEMIQKQDGKCVICGGILAIPYIDHCHATNKIREVLCGPCNNGLGLFKDSPELLEAAIKY